jgi:hypothetical protein
VVLFPPYELGNGVAATASPFHCKVLRAWPVGKGSGWALLAAEVPEDAPEWYSYVQNLQQRRRGPSLIGGS